MSTVSVSTFATSTPINGPYFLAYNATTGDTFGTNYGNNTIYKIDSNGIATVLTLTGPNTLNGPYGITIDSLGNLYVTNNNVTGTVSKLVLISDTTYSCTTLTLTVGTLNNPQGITIDSLGNLYITNSSANSVSKLVFSSGTTYSCTALTLTGPNTLSGPYGITFDSVGNLYVINVNVNSVSKLVFSSGTTYSCTTLTLTGGTLSSPRGITINSTGNLYVTNYNYNSVCQIVVSGTTGTVSIVAFGIINGPQGVVFNSSNILFLTNNNNNTVCQIDTFGVVTVLTLTGPNTLNNSPTGITIDSLGNLYVINNNSGTFIISKLEPTATPYTYSCTTLTLTGGTLSASAGITIDSLDNLYVANINNNTVSKLVLTSNTPPTYSYTTLTLTGGTLSSPRGITIDSLGNLYVSNSTANSVSKLVLISGTTYSCTTLTLTGGTLSAPRGITIDSNTGNLFVSNSGNNFVSKIILSGTNGTVSPYITSGLSRPYGIAFNSSKFLYIANFDSNSISATTTASCFNHDTKILCLNKEFQEEYFPIQDLRKGDIVKTYLHGYRKIDLIGKGTFSNKSDIWNKSMYKMVQTDSNGLFEDLIVTGGHAILVDQVTEEQLNAYEPLGLKGYSEKIDDKFLLMPAVSDQFVQLTDDDIYTYYHLVPENNGDDNQRFGIWANGILSETPSKNQFLMHQYQDM